MSTFSVKGPTSPVTENIFPVREQHRFPVRTISLFPVRKDQPSVRIAIETGKKRQGESVKSK